MKLTFSEKLFIAWLGALLVEVSMVQFSSRYSIWSSSSFSEMASEAITSTGRTRRVPWRSTRCEPTQAPASCPAPIARPLLDVASPIEAEGVLQALAQIPPTGGTLYAEGDLASERPIQIRDVPNYGRHRQFGTRRVFVHKEDPT